MKIGILINNFFNICVFLNTNVKKMSWLKILSIINEQIIMSYIKQDFEIKLFLDISYYVIIKIFH